MAITSKGIIASLGEAMSNYTPPVPTLAALAFMVPSTVGAGSSEPYDFIGLGPAFTEWVGKRKPGVPLEYEYSVKNRKFEATMQIPLDWVENDKTGLVEDRIAGMESNEDDLFSSLVAELINNGNTATCFDDKTFFATDHEYGKTGAFSNKLTETVASTASITPVEFADAVNNAIATMQGYLKDNGTPAKETMTEITIIVPTTLSSAASQAINNKTLQGSGGPVDNPLAGNLKTYKVNLMATPRMTLGNKLSFVIQDSSPRARAFVIQDNAEANKMTAKAEGSDFEHDEDAWEFGQKKVCNGGYGLPTDAVSVTFAE